MSKKLADSSGYNTIKSNKETDRETDSQQRQRGLGRALVAYAYLCVFVHSCANEMQCTGTQCLHGVRLRVRALPVSHKN